MLTPGAEQKMDAASAGILAQALAQPARKSVSQVAARATPPAYAVVGPQVRTPKEASDILRRGRPMESSEWVYMLSTPPSNSIFLFQGELGHHGVGFGFKRGRIRHGSLCGGSQGAAKKGRSEARDPERENR